ncbi:hypothetical protein R1sor_004622 [Riccia sorocarpa]|uniref:Uncharacterized protein n=1 Tax=Riccia sorocarpa TaxID=122646 RepID=A0ABD3HLI5_9MARC
MRSLPKFGEMKWVQATGRDFKGDPPTPRSGHTAVKVGKSLLAYFGGLMEKKFLNDLTVLDTETMQWYQPECTGSGESGHIGPSPRAFHVSVAIDCHLFIFGGRCGRKRLGDFWMLDTDTWQWAELSGYGELPPPREFAAGASVGNGKIVIYGGWDGEKWLSDVYVLDTISLEWRQLIIQGPSPSARCGHSVTMVEKRLLIFGGRGAGGAIMGDLWALKGLFDEERESPGWTQLKLPGTAPSARCGHSTTSLGPQLFIFAGHSVGGWLTRYDVYHNDCVVLDRASVQWKKLSASGEPPPRAYHTMSRVNYRCLLLGGYDGKNTFGDIWWLVPDGKVFMPSYFFSKQSTFTKPQSRDCNLKSLAWKDDPLAKRAPQAPRTRLPSNSAPPDPREPLAHSQEQTEKGGTNESPVSGLRQRLGLPPVAVAPVAVDASTDDDELVELGRRLLDGNSVTKDRVNAVKAVRDHWQHCDVQQIRLHELDCLLRDYQRLVAGLQSSGLLEDSALHGEATLSKMHVYRFYHFRGASQVRMDDIPSLMNEYRQLLHMQLLDAV